MTENLVWSVLAGFSTQNNDCTALTGAARFGRQRAPSGQTCVFLALRRENTLTESPTSNPWAYSVLTL